MEYRKKLIDLRKKAESISSAALPAVSGMMGLLSRRMVFLKEMFSRLRLQFRDHSLVAGNNSGTGNSVEIQKDDAGSVHRKKILVSRCLYGGEAVRYDGRENSLQDSIFLRWKEEGRLIPVCPEVDAGLSVPRLPSERQGKKVICCDGTDLTSEYLEGSVHALQMARQHQVAFAIMKENSPACGSSYIYDGKFTGKTIHGEGFAVEILRNAEISVFSENELAEAAEFLEELEAGDNTEPDQGIRRRSGIMRGYIK